MKNPCLLLLLAALPAAAMAQQADFTKTYNWAGSDMPFAIAPTPDGGYVMAGRTTSYSNQRNAFLMKINQQGDSVWMKTYPGPAGMSGARAVQVMADGSIVMAGNRLSSAGDLDAWMQKTDAQGNVLWSQTYGGNADDFLNALQLTPDGGFIASGGSDSNPTNQRQVFLVKAAADGTLQWEQNHGGDFLDEAWTVKVAQNGDYLVGGNTYSYSSNPGADNYLYLLRTNPQGDTLWTRSYGQNRNNWAADLVETASGDIVTTGLKNNSGNSSTGEIFLIKSSASGTLIWDRSINLGMFVDEARKMLLAPDGGFYLAGCTVNGHTALDAFLLKTDAEGAVQWQQTYTNNNAQTFEFAHGLTRDSQGKIIICGTKGYTQSIEPDLFVMKFTDNTISGLSESGSASSFALYPNPASAEITVTGTDTGQPAYVHVLNTLGQQVYQTLHTANTALKIDVSGFAPGVYLMQLSSAGSTHSSKFVVR